MLAIDPREWFDELTLALAKFYNAIYDHHARVQLGDDGPTGGLIAELKFSVLDACWVPNGSGANSFAMMVFWGLAHDQGFQFQVNGNAIYGRADIGKIRAIHLGLKKLAVVSNQDDLVEAAKSLKKNCQDSKIVSSFLKSTLDRSVPIYSLSIFNIPNLQIFKFCDWGF